MDIGKRYLNAPIRLYRWCRGLSAKSQVLISSLIIFPAYKCYDLQQENVIRQKLISKAKEKSDVLMPMYGVSGKISFYFMDKKDDQKAVLKIFKRHVKPILDVSSLDVEKIRLINVFEAANHYKLQEESKWQEKKDSAKKKDQESSPVESIEERNKRIQEGMDQKKTEIAEKNKSLIETRLVEHLKGNHIVKPFYPIEKNGLVAFGRAPFKEMMRQLVNIQNINISQFETSSSKNSDILSHQNIPYLPHIGYMMNPYAERFYQRCIQFFHRRYLAESLGEAALKVVSGRTICLNEMFPGELTFTKNPPDQNEIDVVVTKDITSCFQFYA